MKMTIGCGSTHPQVVRAAREFPEKLYRIHGDSIRILDTAVYRGNGAKGTTEEVGIDVACSICGHEWKARAISLINRGCGCKQCSFKTQKVLAGKIRRPRATQQEKDKARTLVANGLTIPQVAKELGRATTTVRTWVDEGYKERMRAGHKAWLNKGDNKENANKQWRNYAKTTTHGKAATKAARMARELRYRNVSEYVFLDNEWHAVDRKETYRIWGQVLVPPKERKELNRLYLKADELSQRTGVEHHIDHIQPLSKGGEHLAINLQVITAQENLSKGDTFRIEDQAELCKRLFN